MFLTNAADLVNNLSDSMALFAFKQKPWQKSVFCCSSKGNAVTENNNEMLHS